MLPARFPNLLVNGSSGIAVGMATNIPPHNLREVAGAVDGLHRRPRASTSTGLMEHVKGPDFPGGGTIMGARGHPRRLRLRPRLASGSAPRRTSSRCKGGKEAIIVTELPFMVKKGGDGGLITKIADLVREKKIAGISDLRDESDRSGMRLVIELKRGAIRRRSCSTSSTSTPRCSTSFGVNMVALVDGVPRTLEPARDDPPLRRPPARGRHPAHPVRAAPAPRRRAHILEGLLIALDNLDAVIKLIRGSRRPRRRPRRA